MTDSLAKHPPFGEWHDWTELDPKAWPRKVERNYTLVPTTCFNCEAACGLVAFIDNKTGQVVKFEGNPEHPASRGRNCAKGPATINQIHDTERILYPLKRNGARGSGHWERITWDQALDEISAKVREALLEDRTTEVMYHVGRPGEDGYTERVLKAWGVDGHNSHTNICSSNARIGYQSWMGHDRPSSDFANAEVIFLISSHLEAGHYFNPHAQRIMEGKAKGAKLIVCDTRLSNSGAKADYWLSTWPGTEAFLCLTIARLLIEQGTWERDFVRRWVNWETYLRETRPDLPCEFESLEPALLDAYRDYTPERAQHITGVDAATIREIAAIIGAHPTKLSTHTWRSAGAGNYGGWQVARSLFFLNVLTGSVATEGGTAGSGWNKMAPPQPFGGQPITKWNEMTWPREYPLAYHEMSMLLPHFLNERRGKLAVYFSRVYNPIWTNPDGFSWLEALLDQTKVEMHVALTPTWSETALFADYVLPMGLASERHDLASFETQAGRWVGFRQPVHRRYAELQGESIGPERRTYEFNGRANGGEVWEENEFWIDLSWKIDPDGFLGIREYFESHEMPGTPVGVDEYYAQLFTGVPGLDEAATAAGQTSVEFMRDRGAFNVPGDTYQPYERVVDPAAIEGCEQRDDGVWVKPGTAAAWDGSPDTLDEIVLDKLGDGSPAVEVDGELKAGFPTPSKKLELFSETLSDWGWPEYATPKWIPSHVHWEGLDLAGTERILLPTFRIPTLIHTRSGNSKWLNEISHRHPLWLHPSDAEKLGIEEDGLVRVTTRIGYFVIGSWRTEGIRPGVVAASHHMGRWRVDEDTGRAWNSGKVTITREPSGPTPGRGSIWRMTRDDKNGEGMEPWDSSDNEDGGDADTQRVWWKDTGVHQNLTFAVQPDPVSGMQCWHQRVHITPAESGDKYGDVAVDTAKARGAYRNWLAMTRPARGPLRRPLWYARPLKPEPGAYRLP